MDKKTKIEVYYLGDRMADRNYRLSLIFRKPERPKGARYSLVCNLELTDEIAQMENPEILDWSFRVFNNVEEGEYSNFSSKHHIRSLSVGDIVRINDEYYLCQPIGWDKMSKEDINCFIHEKIK